jgi:hypothetical protein
MYRAVIGQAARARQVQRQRIEEQRIRLGELTYLVVPDEEVVGLWEKAVVGDEVERQGAGQLDDAWLGLRVVEVEDADDLVGVVEQDVGFLIVAVRRLRQQQWESIGEPTAGSGLSRCAQSGDPSTRRAAYALLLNTNAERRSIDANRRPSP